MFYVILLTLAIVAVVAWLNVTWDTFLPDLIGILSSVALAIMVIIWPIQHAVYISAISEFHSVQQSLDAARERGDDWERAAIQQTVFESNKWLASAKYWNSTIWDPMIPDAVDELEPIR